MGGVCEGGGVGDVYACEREVCVCEGCGVGGGGCVCMGG